MADKSGVSRLHQYRLTLLIAKSKIDAIGADGMNAYRALGPAGRGGPARIERNVTDVLSDLDRLITALAEDEADAQLAEMRGDNTAKLPALKRKRDYLDRRIAELEAKETAHAVDAAKAGK